MVEILYREALRLGIDEALEKDPNVFIMGEDIGAYGGAYAVTDGLLDKYGPDRVKDTPISEATFIGAGVGAAMAGLIPIVELMSISFSLVAFDQIVNMAANIKYMSEKQKAYFKKRLVDWKNEIVESNTKGLYLSNTDHEISSPDIVDQASSQTEKTVEMRTLNRQIKLLSKIDKAIKRIDNNTYGYCDETGEPIGLKRLIARPIATLSIEAQEKHERNEKIFADG